MPSKLETVGHRDHPLRRLQKSIQPLTPQIVKCIDKSGMLDGTVVHDVLLRGEQPHPDDLTFAGLQLIVNSAHKIINGEPYEPFGPHAHIFVGGILDALDGSLARYLGLDSPDGGAKDVIADRETDKRLADIIEGNFANSQTPPIDFEALELSFFFSTITKAASEMCGIKTSESIGNGGMGERRERLLQSLLNINLLKKGSLPQRKEIELDKKIHTGLLDLNRVGKLGAISRMDAFIISPHFQKRGWDNPSLHDPLSSAAIEARKYATVLRLAQYHGLDVVSSLNEMNGGVVFPNWEEVALQYPYVQDCIKNTDPFLQKILTYTPSNV